MVEIKVNVVIKLSQVDKKKSCCTWSTALWKQNEK